MNFRDLVAARWPHRVFGVVLLAFLFGASAISCSSDSGDGDSSAGKKSPSAFTAAVDGITRSWGAEAASRFFDEAVKQSPLTAEIKAFNDAGVAKALCTEIESFKPDEKEGATFDSKSDAVAFAKESVLDGAVAGLLGHAFAGDTAQRDQRLAALQVGRSTTQTVDPIESLSGAGLLDASGRPTVPATELVGSGPGDAYEKFRDWLLKGSPALLFSGEALTEGIDAAVDSCSTRKT